MEGISMGMGVESGKVVGRMEEMKDDELGGETREIGQDLALRS